MRERYPGRDNISHQEQEDLLLTHQIRQSEELTSEDSLARIRRILGSRMDTDPGMRELVRRGYSEEDLIPAADDEELMAKIGVREKPEGTELFIRMATFPHPDEGEPQVHVYPDLPVIRVIDGYLMHFDGDYTHDHLVIASRVHTLHQELQQDEAAGLLPNISADKLRIEPPASTMESEAA